ncbi:hypothetical protein [Pseudomonas ogarae]|uniref:Uncharacterized protein n=1 Tax=Pseudomonas ogarae (strain DSM 112162 / CECT 30235 / F113) TaxID=1114970 RepID=A0ABM6QX31_PSEO1|nr:hypothetical protein [Pseudomonas ogarae]AUO45818.1 hypothetical protein C1C98_10350 [Pseudomonas ogarae]
MDAAGFDKLSNVVPFNGLVGTAGLGNCIAVAGFNTDNGRMAMAHYNTLFCANGEGDPWNEVSLRNFHKWFVGETKANQFMIGLGAVWFNTAASTGRKNRQGYPLMDDRRFQLIRLVAQVFDYEPIHASLCFTFTVSSGLPILTPYPDETIMPSGWAQVGKDIPYRSF